MTRLAIARCDGALGFAWARVDESASDGVSDVEPLGADGRPSGVLLRARARGSRAPRGAAAWLAVTEGAPVPCVVEATGPDPSSVTVRTQHGLLKVEADRVWPVPAPAARPFACGPALVSARSDLARVPVDPVRFGVRWASNWLRGTFERDGDAGAHWLDVVLLPHQVAAVRQVLCSPSVRHILADEVGLGKTVEALMIWSALFTADPGLRCVIAAPRGLALQWVLEVRRRVEHRLLARALQDLPPFFDPASPVDPLEHDDPRGITLTDHEALPTIAARIRAWKGGRAPLDMLIVDEAHSLNADERAAVDAIAKSARHLLLLTATPREGRRGAGAAREFRRGFAWAAGLVDPKWPPPRLDDEDEARALERTLDLSLTRARELDERAANGEEQGPFEGAGVGALAGADVEATARGAIDRFLRATTLLERVVRNRRGAIATGLRTARRLVPLRVEYREEEIAVLTAIAGLDAADAARLVRAASSSWEALAVSSAGLPAAVKSALDAVRGARSPVKTDAKLEALLDLLAQIWVDDPAAKVVIRCEYIETRELLLRFLTDLLREGGVRATTEVELKAWAANEEGVVGPVARFDQSQDAMLEALREPKAAGNSLLAHVVAFERVGPGGAIALIASDAASSGLNFQFASHLVLYDLPWSPGLAEQWIGRLDRLGQRADEVKIHVPMHPSLPSARLLEVYERIGLFSSTGLSVTPEVDRAILDLLRPTDLDDESWDDRLERVLRLAAEQDEDTDGRGRALDLRPIEPAPHANSASAVAGLLMAVGRAGPRVERDGDGHFRIDWPSGTRDALALANAAKTLRPPEWIGRNSDPEKLAAARERRAMLTLSAERLGGQRWRRRHGVDFVTPRHPLAAEVEDEVSRDPSLALGGFRCGASPRVRSGSYLFAQLHTHPQLGGAAIAWLAAPSEDVVADPELGALWAEVVDGLGRMLRLRVPPVLRRVATRIERDGARRALAQLDIGALLELTAGSASAFDLGPRAAEIGSWLEELEKPSLEDVLSVSGVVGEVVTEVRRYGELRLAQIVARREAQQRAMGTGDVWRGAREKRAADLGRARTLFGILGRLSELAEAGAREAVTPRAVCAGLVEVAP